MENTAQHRLKKRSTKMCAFSSIFWVMNYTSELLPACIVSEIWKVIIIMIIKPKAGSSRFDEALFGYK